MVVVVVGIEDDDGQAAESGGHFTNVADAHAGVEEHRLFSADDEVGNGFFRLMWLVKGVDAGSDLVGFEPGITDRYVFESFVFGTREGPAPIGAFQVELPVSLEATGRLENQQRVIASASTGLHPVPSAHAGTAILYPPPLRPCGGHGS